MPYYGPSMEGVRVYLPNFKNIHVWDNVNLAEFQQPIMHSTKKNGANGICESMQFQNSRDVTYGNGVYTSLPEKVTMNAYTREQERYFILGAADPEKCKLLHGQKGHDGTEDVQCRKDGGARGCDPATWIFVEPEGDDQAMNLSVIPLLIFSVDERRWQRMRGEFKTQGERHTGEFRTKCPLTWLVDCGENGFISREPVIDQRELQWNTTKERWVDPSYIESESDENYEAQEEDDQVEADGILANFTNFFKSLWS